MTDRVLVVIPTLNEAEHIGPLVRQRLAEPIDGLMLVVADGGSTDGTPDLAREAAAGDPRLAVLHNPRRIQSAAVNLAVARYGDAADILVRVDAHAEYPPDYVAKLLAVGRETGVDSVVVALDTVGLGSFGRAVAAAQNSALGAGNSAHRIGGSGWVDHGHHALMRLDAYRAAGGYDETFSHNEDAELDVRIAANGGCIWLTDAVRPVYHPRRTPGALARQYRAYGRGRARTILKHSLRPKVRQLLPALVAPAALAAPLGLAVAGVLPAAAVLAVPAALWLGASLAGGALLAARHKDAAVLSSGPAAAIMHAAWSLGFWEGLVRR